jgi:type III secretory pathway component EscS
MREIVIAEIKNIGSTFNFWAALTEIENSHFVFGVDVVCLCVCVRIT